MALNLSSVLTQSYISGGACLASSYWLLEHWEKAERLQPPRLRVGSDGDGGGFARLLIPRISSLIFSP